MIVIEMLKRASWHWRTPTWVNSKQPFLYSFIITVTSIHMKVKKKGNKVKIYIEYEKKLIFFVTLCMLAKKKRELGENR